MRETERKREQAHKRKDVGHHVNAGISVVALGVDPKSISEKTSEQSPPNKYIVATPGSVSA